MKQGYKSSLGLIFKILIILVLPILLFSYIDSQPTPVVQDGDDEGTRSVAVVNEDLGHTNGTEELILGQDIPTILKDQKDYSWVVVNRSTAEKGFSKQEYDAILYVPSNFSENVMTFKEESPSKASINYVIEPNLEAKESQRIHREMANAKNAINHEISTIYWSYVSQEVNNIRGQFDKILEKEISFQDEMYSFYTPSSKTLATEIEQHKNRLEGILEQTSKVDDVSKDNINNATEAREGITQFTEALDTYKESQSSQEKLFSEFQTENKKSVQDGVESYNKALGNSMKDIEDQYSKQSVLVLDQKDKLQQRFGSMEGKLQQGQKIIDDWQQHQKGKSKDQEDEIIEIAIKIVKEYAVEVSDEKLEKAKGNINKSIEEIKNAPISASLINPIEPDVEDLEELELEELNAVYSELDEEIKNVKAEVKNIIENFEEEPEEEIDPEADTDVEIDTEINWNVVDEKLQDLSEEIKALNENNNQKEIIDNWSDYAKEWEENYNTILTEVEKANKSLIKKIKSTQKNILKNNTLSKVEKENLKSRFDNINDLENKEIISLVSYLESLATYQTVIEQETNVDEDFIVKKVEENQKEIKEILEVNDSFAKELKSTLGVKENNNNDDNFNFIIDKAENNLKSSNESIEKAIEDNSRIVIEMRERADAIGNQISEMNSEMFEWEESPSVEDLNSQTISQYQQGTTNSLESLSELVSSLGENQSNITSDTEKLQGTVNSVQEESDKLNNRWSSNVANTEQVKGDVYDLLGNTIIDGQTNPYIYDYLSNPVSVEGQVDGKVISDSEDRMPPVILFIIILLSGLLIGFLTQYYSSNSYLVQAGLFILLTLAVGLIISIYGLNIYTLNDSQAIMWSAFTILLLMTVTNIVRGGLFIGPFVGWLMSIVMIMFFITPLLNIVVPEFSFRNPVSNVYMGLLYGSSSTSYVLTMIGMIIIVLIMSALIYSLQIMRSNKKADEANEEETS